MSPNKLTRDDLQQLARWTKQDRIALKLLYRASRDGCSGEAFHKLCNGKGATISVGYTVDGYVYGGYAFVSFDSSGTWKKDPSAFLFRLRKAGLVDYMECPAVAAHLDCSSSYGPTFGNGNSRHELSFFRGSHQKEDELFNLSEELMVNIDGSPKRAFDAQGHTAVEFAGSCGNFRDIEVYKVVDVELLDWDRPWRKVTNGWNLSDFESLKLEVSTYRPPEWLKVPQANILLVGQVGAGKSSFCNTVNSLFRGHVTSKATSGSSEHSLTTIFRKYEFRSQIGGRSMKFRLCDTMGLEEGHNFDSINFPYLLDGNIKDRFQFNPTVPITPGNPGFKADPKLRDRVHVVVFVVDGSTVSVVSRVLLEKLKAMRILVNQRGIPMMVLMTKADRIDAMVSDDLTEVYHSREIRDTMEDLSNKTGVPMSYIMPVKSYERETELESPIDILTLTALRQMLRLADDYFEEQMDFLNINPGGESGQESDEDPLARPKKQLEGDSSAAKLDNVNVEQHRVEQKKETTEKKNVL